MSELPAEQTSTFCQNCGTTLNGHFCHQCGQEAKNRSRFFGAVILDLLGNLFSYDSKVVHTLKPLLFKPGFLSREYIQGRYARYLHPFRLYLFTSVVCFLLLGMQGNLFQVESIQAPEIPPELYKQLEEQLDPETKEMLEQAKVELQRAKGEVEQQTQIEIDQLELLGKQLSKKLNEIDLEKLSRLLIESMPKMMLILLPVFALVLKIFYLGSGRYYVEHFVVALHTQSFLYLLFITGILCTEISRLFYPELMVTNTAVYMLLMIWGLLYILFMLRRVYQQSRLITLIKYWLLMSVYFILLGLLVAIAVSWNLINLDRL